MKKQYTSPVIDIVEFEINDIITESLALGDDSSDGNDLSFPDSWGTWYNGRNSGVGGIPTQK